MAARVQALGRRVNSGSWRLDTDKVSSYCWRLKTEIGSDPCDDLLRAAGDLLVDGVSGLLEGRKLAVQESRVHELVLSCGQAPCHEVLVSAKIDETDTASV